MESKLDPTLLFVGDSASAHGQTRNPEQPSDAETLPAKLARYLVTARLGAGTFGVVYRALDPELNREVAIKVPRPDRPFSPHDLQVYLDEARTLARLDHARIVPVYDCGRTEDGLPFVVSKFINGGSLREAMRTSSYSPAEAATLVADIAEALQHAHRASIIHRDVKPANILIDETGRPLLADFGLALRPEAFGQGDVSCGTVAYMSPEQASQRADTVDGRSDVYSLGVVLYELVSGQRPYRGQTTDSLLREISDLGIEVRPLRQVHAELPIELERICAKALAKKSADRYSTAADMAVELRRYVSSTRASTALRQPRRVLASLALLGVITAIMLIVLSQRGNRDATGSNRAESAGQGASTPRPPIRVQSVEIQQLLLNSRGDHERRGLVLRDPYRLREGDAVQFRARLSRPAYCFWLAFRPDGVEELCFPTDRDQPPPRTDVPSYPVLSPDQTVYGLTDGAGMQAFVLVVSERPLPAYSVWRAARGLGPWQPSPGMPRKTICHHDGQWEEVFLFDRHNQTRGAGERQQGAVSELQSLVTWLKRDKQLAAVEAWALPVLPRRPD